MKEKKYEKVVEYGEFDLPYFPWGLFLAMFITGIIIFFLQDYMVSAIIFFTLISFFILILIVGFRKNRKVYWREINE